MDALIFFTFDTDWAVVFNYLVLFPLLWEEFQFWFYIFKLEGNGPPEEKMPF